MLGLRYLLNVRKVLGEGDLNCLVWIVYGLFIIDVRFLLVFCVFFVGFTVAFEVFKRVGLRISGRMPFFPVIFASFVLVGVYIL